MPSLPLRLGAPADFARVRSELRAAAFDEHTICRALGIAAMSDIASVDASKVDPASVPERLPLYLRLFFTLGLVPREEVEQAIDRDTLDAFLSLGLLGTGEFGDDHIYARVLLYPVAGLLMASDRHTHPDGSAFAAPPDIVFPAIYGGTLRFLNLLPASTAETALDLCAGTGIGAFVLARTCRRAISSDVTERCTHFARFNRALNAIGNVDVVCGDLYGAVAGRTFDRIVAHPPYVPSLAVAAIWRDGGMTGEALTRRIVEALPGYLRPGGLCCIVSLGPDTAAAKFEDRARGWLGPRHHEFDVLFAAAEDRTPEAILASLAERDPLINSASLAEMKEVFADADVVSFAHGALVIRRHATAALRPAWTARAKLSDATDGGDLEQAFLLHDRLSEPGFSEGIIDRRVALAPRLEVKVTHRVEAGSLVPVNYVFATDKPFVARGEVDGWMLTLLARLDGTTTPREVHRNAKAEGTVPDGFETAAFGGLLVRMIARGFLVLPEA